MYFLGIDVGTGGSRAIAIDTSGNVAAAATESYLPFSSPQAGSTGISKSTDAFTPY
jgi:xylulokinase